VAKVLFEEKFYDDDLKSFRVLCISFPLIGARADASLFLPRPLR
jgi:hypothetical protein